MYACLLVLRSARQISSLNMGSAAAAIVVVVVSYPLPDSSDLRNS